MKTALASVAALALVCPDCKEPVEARNGSQMFTVEDLEGVDEVRCECGERLKIPAQVKRYARGGSK